MTGIAAQFKQIVVGVVGGTESHRFCGFAKGKTADGSNQRFEARHLAGACEARGRE